jgi:hypothetical protein
MARIGIRSTLRKPHVAQTTPLLPSSLGGVSVAAQIMRQRQSARIPGFPSFNPNRDGCERILILR